MKKLTFGALCIGLLTMAACGGGGGADARVIVNTDGGGDASTVCNITANSGCPVGQKCAWIRVSTGAADTEQLGQLGCAPEGSVAVGGACAWGNSGVATGYDNCVANAICLASPATEAATGECSPICSLSSATLPCPLNYSCGPYYKFFSNGADPALAGICDPLCDPLTRERLTDGAAECGSTTVPPAAPNAGCYGAPSGTNAPTEFSCANMSAAAAARGHRAVLPMMYFSNSCTSGSVPGFFESEGSTMIVCIAMCDPLTVNNTLVANRGGQAPYNCPQVPVLTPTAQATGANEACAHYWFFEGAATPITGPSNDVGLCWDHTKWTWDDDQVPTTANVPWPNPTTLNPYVGDPAMAPATADVAWGYARYIMPLTGSTSSSRADRLGFRLLTPSARTAE